MTATLMDTCVDRCLKSRSGELTCRRDAGGWCRNPGTGPAPVIMGPQGSSSRGTPRRRSWPKVETLEEKDAQTGESG